MQINEKSANNTNKNYKLIIHLKIQNYYLQNNIHINIQMNEDILK